MDPPRQDGYTLSSALHLFHILSLSEYLTPIVEYEGQAEMLEATYVQADRTIFDVLEI